MCLARGGRCLVRQDWIWALLILEEHKESGICVRVMIMVVWVVLGEWVGGLC